MALEQELATYQRELAKFLDKQGKYIVIRGDDVLGAWDTYADALGVAYERCGLKPFLVKRIEAVEYAQFISREIEFPCRS